MNYVAALVKYNPCNIYARGGTPCRYYDLSRRCGKMPDACELPEYDKWYKDVKNGTMQHFYPRRIKLLEIPGTFLIIYNTHKKRIMGESTIMNATVCDNVHYYWFNQFVAYPNPMPLTMIRTDHRLARLEHAGRWKCVYLSAETVEEIRRLAGLEGECKERLEREVELAMKDAARLGVLSTIYSYHRIKSEIDMLSHLGIEKRVLDETEKIFQRATNEKVKTKSHTLMLFAALYLAYRSLGIPKRTSEIAKIGVFSPRKLRNVTRRIRKQLDLELPLISARQWVNRYSSNLNLPAKTIKLAEDLADRCARGELRGKSPISIAAIGLYLACEEIGPKMEIKTITKTFDLTPATFRTLWKEYSSLHSGETKLTRA